MKHRKDELKKLEKKIDKETINRLFILLEK
jgi:hypothetical protein